MQAGTGAALRLRSPQRIDRLCEASNLLLQAASHKQTQTGPSRLLSAYLLADLLSLRRRHACAPPHCALRRLLPLLRLACCAKARAAAQPAPALPPPLCNALLQLGLQA
jgi:hypothetical protein